MINRVVLLGRITRDIELRRSSTGTAVTSFTLAVDSLRRDANGKTMTNFISCVAFGKTAETLERYASKGTQICIDGSLQVSNFQRRDGTNGSRTDVIVSSLTLCGSRNNTQARNEDQFDMPIDDTSSSDDLTNMELADDDLPF